MLVKIIRSDPRAREKPCLRCGTSLRKLLDATHCPQCGLSVWLSLSDNQAMEWSNPTWLAWLSRAAWLMAPLQLLALASYLMLILPILQPQRRYALAAILAGGYLVTYHAALSLLCRNERRYPDRLRQYRLANVIISSLAIAFGAALLLRGAVALHSGWPMPPQLPAATQPADDVDPPLWTGPFSMYSAFASPWLFGSEAILLASAVGTLAYLRKLAYRVPNSTVARICGYALFVPLLALFKVFPFFIYLIVAYMSWLAPFLPLLYYPLTGVLLIWFALALRRCSHSAAESWASETRLPSPPQSS